MMAFIDQEANEKAEEIDAKVITEIIMYVPNIYLLYRVKFVYIYIIYIYIIYVYVYVCMYVCIR